MSIRTICRDLAALRAQTANRVARYSSGSTFRAAVCNKLGDPLEIEQLPRQQNVPKGHIRISIQSAAVNYADILIAQGLYQEKNEVPYVAGTESSGTVLEVGEGVKHLAAGDSIFGIFKQQDSFAEERIAPAKGFYKAPSGASFDVSASFMSCYSTAYTALKWKANVQPGQTVLVTAAAGSFGLAAVDLAANVFKCNVIGACGDESKVEAVKSKGAAECIVYTKDRLRDKVKELTDGKGAEVIVDAVGGSIFEECTRCVAFEGQLIVVGFACGDIPSLPTNILLVKSCTAKGVYWTRYAFTHPEVFSESVRETSRLVGEGQIHPHIGATFNLDQVNEAFKYVTDRKNIGKIIIHTQQ